MGTATATVGSATKENRIEVLDVLVVGAGFSGIFQLDRYRELGFTVKAYEAGERTGGIWYWNRYPGARVDSTGFLYQFSREDLWKDFDYDELFPGWQQVRRYFDHVEDKLDLAKDIRFNTRVVSCVFDEDERHWVVETDQGGIAHARFVIMCTGIGARPRLPEIPGIEDFAGESHHTGRWPEEGVDLSAKRVGVIGTGATGVQVIQESAKTAGHLTVFQRTPNIALPMRQRQLDDAGKLEMKQNIREKYAMRPKTYAGFEYDFAGASVKEFDRPDELMALYEEYWETGGFKLWLGAFFDVLTDDAANLQMYEFWRDKVRERVNDPQTAELLAPTVPLHPFGTRRPSLEQNYYDAYNQGNVDLVDVRSNPIERITERGVRLADGTEYELDLLIYATGFDTVTGSMSQMDIRATDGELLRDKWNRDGVDAYLGTYIHGLPNMAMMNGPLSPCAWFNGPSAAELQGREIVWLLEHAREHGHTRFESTREADKEWRDLCAELAEQTLLPQAPGGWYMGGNVPGKPRQLVSFCGGVPAFLEANRELRASGYERLVFS